MARVGGSALAVAAGGQLAPQTLASSRDTSCHVVPYFRQEHLLSCEMAALRMAAAYLGEPVSEEALLKMLAFDETPLRIRKNGTLVWGDPRKGFVGNLDGWQMYYGGWREHPPHRRNVRWWGYGVYVQPVADVATKIGLAASCIDELDDIYWHLDRHQPVIAIVPAGGKTETVTWGWYTEQGGSVPVMNREHAVVLNPGYDERRICVSDPGLDRDEQIFEYTHRDFARAFSVLSMAVAVGRPRRSLRPMWSTHIE